MSNTSRVSRLEVYSAFPYCPSPTSKIERISKSLGLSVKKDEFREINGNKNTNVINYLVHAVVKQGSEVLTECFDKNTVIIPCVGHAPRRDPTSLWVAKRIADQFQLAFLGLRTETLIERTHAVRKSALAAKGERPTVEEHLKTLSLLPLKLLNGNESITLLDDLVTRGATLVAHYILLKQQYPNARIRLFALFRTCQSVSGENQLNDPIKEMIEYDSNTQSIKRYK